MRPEHVKNAARELVELYPDKFTTDFQTNKKIIESLATYCEAKSSTQNENIATIFF